jgi:hypothetical protein
VVADPLTGVVGGGYQPGVGSEPVSALEGTEISYSDQKLRSKKHSHTRQTGEDRCFRAGEKTPLQFLVDALDAVLEGEDLCGELRDDAGGDLLCRQATLWDPAALSALCATLLDPLTRRFFR